MGWRVFLSVLDDDMQEYAYEITGSPIPRTGEQLIFKGGDFGSINEVYWDMRYGVVEVVVDVHDDVIPDKWLEANGFFKWNRGLTQGDI